MRVFTRVDLIDNGKINEENLDIFCKQIEEQGCYDKVGHWFYNISKDMAYSTNNRSVEYVNAWLDHLNTLKQTSKNIGFKREIHQSHIDNPEQYDENGCFIPGTGEICPSCGTEWEDHFSVVMCPCHDR